MGLCNFQPPDDNFARSGHSSSELQYDAKSKINMTRSASPVGKENAEKWWFFLTQFPTCVHNVVLQDRARSDSLSEAQHSEQMGLQVRLIGGNLHAKSWRLLRG